MFGPFRITNPLSGGLLWKIPWRLSKFQKRRHRLRLRAVDNVVATLDAALAKQGQTLEALERWKAEMPTEAEMLPKDKYTMFDRKEKRYRKGIHSMLPSREADGTGNADDGYRTTKVDESVPTSQPPRILRWARWLAWITVLSAQSRHQILEEIAILGQGTIFDGSMYNILFEQQPAN